MAKSRPREKNHFSFSFLPCGLKSVTSFVFGAQWEWQKIGRKERRGLPFTHAAQMWGEEKKKDMIQFNLSACLMAKVTTISMHIFVFAVTQLQLLFLLVLYKCNYN